MSFNSLQYGAFFLVVFGLFWSLPKRARPTLLLVASIAFYATWGWLLVVALFAVAGFTWLCARSIRAASDPGVRRRICTVAVSGSLAVVFGLRYLGHHIGGATEGSTPTAFGGVDARAIIPVGLAFITFQAISYVVDTYRNPDTPAASFPDHVLYVAFFPHLLAGPVMRARRLIPSFHEGPDRPSKVQLSEGAELILVGLFKKVALADPGFTVVTRVGIDPTRVSSGEMWLLWLLGLTSAYFDITGYIDIARGSARMLGIDLHPNAASPLLRSTELADFWRRWQVTVMAWFRDYVFLPVRGRSRTATREALGLLTVFVALAVWHGTTVNWLVWGTLTGTIVVVERQLQARRAAKARALAKAMAGTKGKRIRGQGTRTAAQRAIRLAYVYLALIMTLPWIGSPNVQGTLDTYRALLGFRGGSLDGDTIGLLLMAVVALVLLDGREKVRQQRSGRPDRTTLLRAVGYGVMVVGIIVFSGATTQPFIYLRF